MAGLGHDWSDVRYRRDGWRRRPSPRSLRVPATYHRYFLDISHACTHYYPPSPHSTFSPTHDFESSQGGDWVSVCGGKVACCIFSKTFHF